MFHENCHTYTHLFTDMFSYPTLTRNKNKKKAKQNKKEQPSKM